MDTTAGLFLIGMFKICIALVKSKRVALFWHGVTMRTIRTTNTTQGFRPEFPNRMHKICTTLNKEKQHRFIQANSDDEDDEDDQDDEYDSKVFLDRDAQNLHRIKQRKERCCI